MLFQKDQFSVISLFKSENSKQSVEGKPGIPWCPCPATQPASASASVSPLLSSGSKPFYAELTKSSPQVTSFLSFEEDVTKAQNKGIFCPFGVLVRKALPSWDYWVLLPKCT